MGLVRDIRLPNGRLAHPGSTWLQHKTVSSINAANFLNKAHFSLNCHLKPLLSGTEGPRITSAALLQ
jgi:hypothetical protein